MNLTTDQLTELLSAVSNGSQQLFGPEKRQTPRVSTQFPVICKPIVDSTGRTGAPVEAWLRDISTSGLGLVLRQRMEDGTSFVVGLPTRSGQTTEFLCLCCHCSAQPDRVFHVGGQFLAQWLTPVNEQQVA